MTPNNYKKEQTKEKERTMTRCNNDISILAGRTILLVMLFMLFCIPLGAQVITIGGDVYGGGREGAVGTGKVTDAAAAKNSVTLKAGALSGYSTSVTVYSGSMRTIFGGGENGRTFGNTQVSVNGATTSIGGTVSGIDWRGTIHGGVFGAGDGELAYVFGNSNVLINGGRVLQNVYGGGNQADLIGATNVTLRGGELECDVYGGARVANVFGYSYVDIDGENATGNIIVNAVYGGNDIGGDISSGTYWEWTQRENLVLPANLSYTAANGIDNTWNAFVHSSVESADNHIFVGQLFGGGNGDYSYTPNGTDPQLMDMNSLTEREYNDELSTWEYRPYTYTVATTPEVSKVYLEIEGGTFGYLYGGGNNATVTQSVDICLDNHTSKANIHSMSVDDLTAMGVSVDESNYTVTDGIATPNYQFDRVFGGNNKAAMNVHPNWHLEHASINNLYSGGNAGNMTFRDGLLLALTGNEMLVNTVYGGCRMADVLPEGNNVPAKVYTIGGTDYSFPAGHSARLLITAGTINNVYGGNDISGNIQGGNALDIRSSIKGDVYGGGNGSYAYTDNPALRSDSRYADFYYDASAAESSVKALNAFRPNSEQVWIHVSGTEENPTLIGGSLYCGGNSATINIEEAEAEGKHAILYIGSYVIAQDVFMGSNGANMIDADMMALYHNGEVNGHTFSTIDMTTDFAEYIKGVSVNILPEVRFESGYVSKSAKIGSFFVGGNLGSMTASGTFNLEFTDNLVIFNKLVAGCNNTNYQNATYGIDYEGGLTTAPAAGNPKIIMDMSGITLMPGVVDLDENDKPYIAWNKSNVGGVEKLVGGNIYGGCYESGYINGDVVLNLTTRAMNSTELFVNGAVQNSGVNMEDHLDDVFDNALSLFGGGYGIGSSIHGNTTVNISGAGSILRVFGGGLEGVVDGNTTINITGGQIGKIYGGGFEGRVTGSTRVNLDGGTVHSVFGGACNATIEGYAHTYIGTAGAAMTTVQENVYGGNDFGGEIEGSHDFSSRITRAGVMEMVYNPTAAATPAVLTANSYVEYSQGKIGGNLFGGSCGAYNYSDPAISSHIEGHPLPLMASSFVYFNANNSPENHVGRVFAAGQGAPGVTDGSQDRMQDRSYLLVDAERLANAIADTVFAHTEFFGAGAYSGLGMRPTPAEADSNPLGVSAVVDLVRGNILNAYGAGYNEGVTRRTVVNVPQGSTIKLAAIYGGGYGNALTAPCDAYESNVNYNSNDATVSFVYGANNNSRRTLYSFVNISSPVWKDRASGSLATIYGAGNGENTWAQYTRINLNNGAKVHEVYGGGYGGRVLNYESVTAWKAQDASLWTVLGTGYIDNGLENALVQANGLGTKSNTNIYINRGAVIGNYIDNRPTVKAVTITGGYCYGGGYGQTAVVSGSTYVGLHGGRVWKDLYGGGTYGGVMDQYGAGFTACSNAFIEGGSVRNVYGAGWQGRVGYTELPFNDVDLSSAQIASTLLNDRLGESNVVMGISEDLREVTEGFGFYKGVPAVERNIYGSGEDGGAVLGTANLTVHNGYVGYRYFENGTDDPETDNDERYEEKVNDETWWDYSNPSASARDSLDRLTDSGNVFGGGYSDNAIADFSRVNINGGHIRNSVYGGGEVAAIGRGEALETPENAIRVLKGIYKTGSTEVNIYSGHIMRNVFGGGKGYNNVGEQGERLTNGYVFGTTAVYVMGGEIGTTLTAQQGDGNVFGGGNIGYVFNSSQSKKWNEGVGSDGYYYLYDPATGDWILDSGEKQLSEDCKVVVTPYAKVLANEGIDLTDNNNAVRHFNKNEYVPTEYLNRVRSNNPSWGSILDETGITIRNAVFAGGNVSSGQNLYANTRTVFGNATATLNDLYYCDLISLGTERVGGLYGDGNLTLVDGYRELNITNYGTDYYGVNTDHVTIEEYRAMSDRERAYFEVKYECTQDFVHNGTPYKRGLRKTTDEIRNEFMGSVAVNLDGSPNSDYWEEYGFVSIYAGRLINTIQRADFVGVFGSRMVMQGARDRVPEVVDYTDYTINRVGEISLNRSLSPDGAVGSDSLHGNYFGIYNIVHYLGAITSDVDFDEVRTTNNLNEEYTPDREGQSFYEWKSEHRYARKRNNGSVDNKVALAAGVFLELSTEKSTPEQKDWGIVTGVLELDLINVMPGMGGGYVYAKNVHGTRNNTGLHHITLSDYNADAVSNKLYSYDVATESDDMHTSGNFIHPLKQIIDDCYPTSSSYAGANPSEAHYWYIKGQIYLYDQYISAYTGAANAYSKTVNIPLTITAGSHGTLRLSDVKKNKYAYYNEEGTARLAIGEKALINNLTYYLNDTISYWDWSLLSVADQNKFVDDTYITIAECMIGETTYPEGYTMLPQEYNDLYNGLDAEKEVYHVAKGRHVPFKDLFKPSNNMGHDNGFALTMNISNPMTMDNYYTPITGPSGDKLNSASYNGQEGYYKAPTYRAVNTGVFGRHNYEHGDIITHDVWQTSMDISSKVEDHSEDATFERAYVLTQDMALENVDGTMTYWNSGLVIPESDYTAQALGSAAGPALFCVETWKMEGDGLLDEYIFYGTSMTEEQIREMGYSYGYTTTQMDEVLATNFKAAYYCTQDGKAGGNYYQAGMNYLTIEAWSAMNPEDRANFEFNYDALDLLIDPAYSGNIHLYDGGNPALYAAEQRIDYTAKYHGSEPIVYTDPESNTVTVNQNDILTNEQYESIPNEQYHYASFRVDDPSATYYIVNTEFSRGDIPYSVGNVITEAIYNDLSHPEYVDVISGIFTAEDNKYYYCREPYRIGANGSVTGKSGQITDLRTTNTFVSGQNVPTGAIITSSNYDNLPNLQTDFTVHGETPVETTTLYVSGQSDIQELSSGKIVTVTYTYSYDESDESGKNIEHITEKHIINIYVNFKGGNPTIGQLNNLATVLPGSTVGVTQPRVTPGAYEVIGGGWEIFANEEDATEHVNGVPFNNTNTKLYWYNDGYYLAYYAKTYLGKTYSNAVPFRVGNYHDLDKVMADTLHHMYVDHPNVKHNSKIYIDGRDCTSNPAKNELDLLRDFHELSLVTLTYDENHNPIAIDGGTLDGHVPLNKHVAGTENIEFILNSDIAPKYYTEWTPIGATQANCFKGNLHGDGHTVSGLDNSLFGWLCGDVYNLGVTGSFASAGVANNGGYAQNCWVMTTTDEDISAVKAVMGTGVVVNGYYPQENSYSGSSTAKAMPMSSFRDGEVAYNLNGFYLDKRHAMNNGGEHSPYYYTITDQESNALSTLPEGYVEAEDYVARRFRDGDFIYADGTIPTATSERIFYVEPAEDETPDPKNGKYFPIWPDDYIFFGQMLSYGYAGSYNLMPVSVNREDRSAGESQSAASQWLAKENSGRSNRIYRAPAYFGNSTIDMVHFNANAVLPATTHDGIYQIYPGLTAIDLTGYSDNTWNSGWDANGRFMTRILDYNGLTGFRSDGQTQNLLVYTTTTDDSRSMLSSYLADQTFSFDNVSYGTIPVLEPAKVAAVRGHLVLKSGNLYKAASDQFLVDRHDFNAPISYSFDEGDNMWYQREPERFVESMSSGWEAISLPFTAQYVTTQNKGELTHFYSGSKVGHEYWLREFTAVNQVEGKAQFATPAAGNTAKTVGNTFLWDYYYNKNTRKDANDDDYQTYYREAREYGDYPLYAAGKPYLIGFPGARYYEFDLSGTFRANNTAATAPAQLASQTMTFVSVAGQVIEVTDQEYENSEVESGNWIYRPTYQAQEVASAYLIQPTGESFEQSATAVTVPFRAYIRESAMPAPMRSGTRSGGVLYIDNIENGGDSMEQLVAERGLNIYTENRNICIENTLDYAVEVTITNLNGIQLKRFTAEPATKSTVPVNRRGVYIVNRNKIAVR